ncbi:MAG: asparagine synthase-related protein [Pseudolabrys sp.]
MSVIAGLWRLDDRPDAADGCARMLAAQEMYGRDGGAQWADGPVALGRRLTRLLPEDTFDRQPLLGAGGKFVLVADVRLDNRDDLAPALGIPSERARGLCDAAILLAAFEKWDDDCCDRLIGDYAFALWDANNKRLLLARSPMGHRPLHFHRGKDFFAFASMPKGLHTLPEVPYAPDEDKVAELLALLPDADNTHSFFAGIERVLPGHLVTIAAAGVATRRHWQPQRRTIKLRGAEEYTQAMRHHLDEAVRCRLRATTEIGAQLSGGFDSAAVVTTAARLLAPQGRKVTAFTAVPREGYDGPVPFRRIGDEGPLAAATAAMHPNIEHVFVRAGGRALLDDLDRTFLLYDQPFNNLCNMGWIHGINDAARDRKLKVLLSGAMGNMTVSYDGQELLPELFRGGHWLRWRREAAALVRRRRMRWRGILAKTFSAWIPVPVWQWLNRMARGHANDISINTAVNPSRVSELDLHARARERGLDFSYRPRTDGFEARLWVLRRRDVGNYNKGILGGWGIDVRDPTEDRRLVEFCLAVPTEQFLANGELKALGRRVLADRVPRVVLDQTQKGYQAVDWHERFTAARPGIEAELARLQACAPAARALDLARLQTLVENWPAEGWERDDVRASYRAALGRGISSGYFLRRATGGNR